MRRDVCLMTALCSLVSLLAVAMATEGKTGPVPLVDAMATEKNTSQGPLPTLENDKRLSSPKLGPESEQRPTGSNSSLKAAGKGQLHVLLSSADQEKHIFEPPFPVSQDGRGQMKTDTSGEMNPPSIAASPYDPDQDHSSGRLLVAVARTLVTTTASTTTVIVLSTCHTSTYATTACTGRRKRKRSVISPAFANADTVLDSSVASDPELFDKPMARTGRFILWQSSITTILITTTSTNTATVITASFTCSPAGVALCAG